MKFLTIPLIALLFSSCMTTSSTRSSATNAKAEKDRLLNFYTGEIASIFGTKLNDSKVRNNFFNSRNDFEVSQWIANHLAKELQYYERKIEDDFRGYLRSNAPSKIAIDSNRLEKLVQIIGEDFKLMVEMYLIDWKKRHE